MGDRGPVHTSSSARPCWERWKTGLDGRSARTSRAAAPATHTMTDWQVQASPTMVDVWCERRLQFNSKPETVALRTAIGDAVAQLQAAPGQILSATFTSAGTDLVDAENVLVYNVGAARFKAASREGIRFERVHAIPEQASHHHRYELVDRDSTSHHWRRLETVVRCSVPITRIDDQSKPDSVWQAVRREAGTAPLDSGLYGLQVTLSTPRPVRLASLIKPLLDGLISGLHCFEGAELGLVSSRLAGFHPLIVGAVIATQPAGQLPLCPVKRGCDRDGTPGFLGECPPARCFHPLIIGAVIATGAQGEGPL